MDGLMIKSPDRANVFLNDLGQAVKKAAKNIVDQSKDVVDAVKGKKKRCIKTNYKTKTNNSKKRKK